MHNPENDLHEDMKWIEHVLLHPICILFAVGTLAICGKVPTTLN